MSNNDNGMIHHGLARERSSAPVCDLFKKTCPNLRLQADDPDHHAMNGLVDSTREKANRSVGIFFNPSMQADRETPAPPPFFS